MKRGLLLVLATVVFLAGVVVPSYAQGKSNTAPGQQKKQEQGNTGGQNTPPGQEKKAENSPTSQDSVDPGPQGPKPKDFTPEEKGKKLGVQKLLEKLAESTESGKKPQKLKKVIVREATGAAQLKRRAVMGVISDIVGNIITLVHQIQRSRIYQVSVNEQTVYHIKGIATGSGSLADLAVGQRIAAVGDLADDGGILAKRIHGIPGKATGIFRRFPIATPSATPSGFATPSATPTSTPSATFTPTPTL